MWKGSPLITIFPFGIVALVLATSASPMLYSEARPKNTAINETSFRLALPGQWSAGDTTDPSRRTYHSASKHEGLTVSIFGSFFGSPDSKTREEKNIIFKHWVENRRQIETRMPDFPDVKLQNLSTATPRARWLRDIRDSTVYATDGFIV